MEFTESRSSLLDLKMHDPDEEHTVDEEDAFTSTLRRAREDSHFGTFFLRALTSGDDAYISRIFGGLGTDDPRLSALIKKQVAIKETYQKGNGNGKFCSVRPGRDDALIAEMQRKGRKRDAELFRREYYYGSSMDTKRAICHNSTWDWKHESCGVSWIGVHGMKSICVVTKAGELDLTRVHRYLKYETVEKALCKFRKAAISDIEDLASPSSKLSERIGHSIPKPFSVVSLALGSDDAHEESGRLESSDEDEEEKQKWEKRKEYMPTFPGYDKKKTIKYLREQMRKDAARTNDETVKASSTEDDFADMAATDFLQKKMKLNLRDFTLDETIKTAISAFQTLFGKKFKSHEIGVSVVEYPGYSIKKEEIAIKDLHAKHLEMNDIQNYLAAIEDDESHGRFSKSCETTVPMVSSGSDLNAIPDEEESGINDLHAKKRFVLNLTPDEMGIFIKQVLAKHERRKADSVGSLEFT